MKVKIKFYSDLKDKYAPAANDGVVELVLRSDAKIKDVFDMLHIDDGEVGFVLLNENKVEKDNSISDQDVIRIFSFVAGG